MNTPFLICNHLKTEKPGWWKSKAGYKHRRFQPEAGGKGHVSKTGRVKSARHSDFVDMASLSQQFQSVVWPALRTTRKIPDHQLEFYQLDDFSYFFKQNHQWLELCLARVWCCHDSTQIHTSGLKKPRRQQPSTWVLKISIFICKHFGQQHVLEINRRHLSSDSGMHKGPQGWWRGSWRSVFRPSLLFIQHSTKTETWQKCDTQFLHPLQTFLYGKLFQIRYPKLNR